MEIFTTRQEVSITRYKQMLSEKQRLENEIQSLDVQISTYPEGRIHCTRNDTRIKWYNDSKYLPKSERKLAEQLAIKKYLLQKKLDYEHQLKAAESYLQHCSKYPPKADLLLSEKSNYADLLAPHFTPKSQELDEWMHSSYERNLNHPEHLIHKTISGEFVRSKSEVLIATVLSIHQIPYRYEALLQLNKRWVFPDFTLRHPETGKYFYWEHFGKMDDPDYCKKTCSKLELYASCDIIPSIQLITTYETTKNPLTIEQVEHLVRYYFLN